MKGSSVLLFVVLISNVTGDGHLPCANNDGSSFNSWLCGLNDWMESMNEWKQRIEERCFDVDFGTEWSEIYSCSYPLKATCCNETMTRWYVNAFNCSISYCEDGRYANRQKYQDAWGKHQASFQTALRLYDEKLRYCGRSAQCDDIATTTEELTGVENLTTSNQQMNTTDPGQEASQPSTSPVELTTEGLVVIDDTTESEQLRTTVNPGQETRQTPTNPMETTTEQIIMTEDTTEPGQQMTTGPVNATSNETVSDLCPIRFNNTCFIPVTDSLTYNESVQNCEDLGGNLANIYNQSHMDDVINYARENGLLTGSGSMPFILGLKFDPLGGVLYHRDGMTPASEDLRWLTGSPNVGAANAASTAIVLLIASVPANNSNYLANFDASSGAFGSLCETENI